MKNDDIYFAGLFDGEGCVGLRKRLVNSVPYYQVSFAIAMVDRDPLDRAVSVYGVGKVYNAGRPKLARMQAWQWVGVAQQACVFLRLILPYSMTKKPEIELALEYQAHQDKYKHIKPHPPEVLAYREECFLKMKALKVRFPHHPCTESPS